MHEHVREQTARITAAARILFSERGYRATDLEAIAAAVGLARNSVYRYFPNKDHILITCINEDLHGYLAELTELPERYPDSRELVNAWLSMQFELATGPAHVTLTAIADMRDGSDKLMRRVDELVSAPKAVLEGALARFPNGAAVAALRAELIDGMAMAATRTALRQAGAGAEVVRQELFAATNCLIDQYLERPINEE